MVAQQLEGNELVSGQSGHVQSCDLGASVHVDRVIRGGACGGGREDVGAVGQQGFDGGQVAAGDGIQQRGVP